MIFQMMRGYHLTLAVILSVFGVGRSYVVGHKTEEFDFDAEMKRLQDFDEDEYPNFDEEKYPKYLQDEEKYPNFDDGYVSLGQLFPKSKECYD